MRRALAPAALLLACTLALTGCGRSDEVAEPDRLTIDDSPATGEVSVWTAGGNADRLEPFLAQFAEDNPDATVEVTDVPWAEMSTKITSAIAAGTVPDLVLVGLPDIPTLIAGDGIQPVADGVLDSGDILASVQTATEHDGLSYGVPWFVETRLFCYRKDFAALAGATPPATWDELLAFSDALRVPGTRETPLLVPIGADEPVAEFVLPLLAQAGGAATDADGEAYTLDTPEMVAALDYYGTLFQDGHASPDGTVGGDPIGAALSGAIAAFFVGTWIIPAIESQVGPTLVDAAVACTEVPAGAAGAESYLSAATWAVPTDAANPDAAFKLVRSLTTVEAQEALYDTARELPAVTDAWEYAPLAADPWLAIARAQIEEAVTAPSLPSWNELAITIAVEAEKVARGTATAEEAVAAIQAKADELGTGW
jgi:multiple sugar transport system substrate-binding protein